MKVGKLYIIPNFIGMTPSVVNFPLYNNEVVKSLQFFYVENPKPARQLIKALYPEADLNKVEFFEHDKHYKTQIETLNETILCLKNGNDVGVISDAGCPGIADPGSEIVRLAHAQKITVVPLVGPSSIFLTLMASGMNGQHFSFLGYLPKDKDERIKKMGMIQKSISQQKQTFIFIETPYRNQVLFEELLQILNPENYICLGIDVQSPTQEILTKSVKEWKATKIHLKDKQVVFLIG